MSIKTNRCLGYMWHVLITCVHSQPPPLSIFPLSSKSAGDKRECGLIFLLQYFLDLVCLGFNQIKVPTKSDDFGLGSCYLR
jgi:hypothetical protein